MPFASKKSESTRAHLALKGPKRTLMRAASTHSNWSVSNGFNKSDYAGFTGLRKLCNAVMLDGHQDRHWDA
eukprot:6685548-Ditylum_brightwellii.AAC.1